MSIEDPAVQRAADYIKACDVLLVTAGAGLGVDSGLGVFATLSDLPLLREAGVTYDQVSSPSCLSKNPSLFYSFFGHSLAAYRRAEPHEGYTLLRSWARPRRSFVVTSNIDGFFARAGFPSDALSQVHGCIHNWQCGGKPSGSAFPLFSRPRCGDELVAAPADAGALVAPHDGAPPDAPRCSRCGDGLLRPNVFLFGDNDFVATEEVTRAKAFFDWRHQVLADLERDAGLRLCVVEVGCGLRVPSVRKRGEDLVAEAPRGQAVLVRINPESDKSKVTAMPLEPDSVLRIQQPALQALRGIQRAMDDEDAAVPADPGSEVTAAPAT